MKRKITLLNLILLVVMFFINPVKSQDNNLVVKLKNGNINSLKISNVKNIIFNFGMMNFHQINGTNAVYANSDIQKLYFESTTEVISIADKQKLFAYPNPTKGIIYFKGLTEESVTISLFNLSGVQVFSGRINSSVQSLDISFLPRGIYLINLNHQIEKLIKI